MSGIFQLQTNNPTEIDQDKKMLTEEPGQEVAVPINLMGQATVLDSYASALNAVTLKAVTLGPHLSVITPEASPPDSQSLEAFARAQGLNENAVHWLFGSNAANLPANSIANPISSQALTEELGIGASVSMSKAQGTPPQVPFLMPSGSSTGQALVNAETSDLTGQGAVTSLLGSALAGAQVLWAMADEPGQAKKSSAPPVPEEVLPIPMLRMPPPAAVWMQRNVFQSVLQNNQNSPKEATISLSELDLGADWGVETLQQLLGVEGGTNGSSSTGTHGTAYANFAARWDAQANHRSDQANANGTSPDLPDSHARSENIQNLAEKMGQAVGQRILTEMEKGQWHLKLQLRPATLGHIEVEMRMRSGEFDAVFIAPNATTRDLLQDGMGKLRETLSQMGMDVANIHVGGGQTGQSGGDSTPGFSRGKTTQAKESTQETTSELSRAPRVKDPKDGLDVLV
jgi:hypothetical protein